MDRVKTKEQQQVTLEDRFDEFLRSVANTPGVNLQYPKVEDWLRDVYRTERMKERMKKLPPSPPPPPTKVEQAKMPPPPMPPPPPTKVELKEEWIEGIEGFEFDGAHLCVGKGIGEEKGFLKFYCSIKPGKVEEFLREMLDWLREQKKPVNFQGKWEVGEFILYVPFEEATNIVGFLTRAQEKDIFSPTAGYGYKIQLFPGVLFGLTQEGYTGQSFDQSVIHNLSPVENYDEDTWVKMVLERLCDPSTNPVSYIHFRFLRRVTEEQPSAGRF
jgi:hypothetical protein